MKLSLKWINEFVDVEDYLSRPELLAQKLTDAGLEVESIENKARDLQSVVVGLILSKQKHPNADKLSLCQVSTGEGVVHQIVCGAQNHKDNDKVIVALPGAILPGNFQIKKSVLRGVESNGMLCSLKELGLAKDSNGIEILNETAKLGQSVAEYFQIDDVVMELKVTPNRSDCLSHLGLAREISALTGKPLKNMSAQEQMAFVGKSSDIISLSVQDVDLCPYYSGCVIKNVKVGPSPKWLKQRIESVGLNSINNIVDCTNLVMMQMGQPLHAFDLSKISDKQVHVRKAKSAAKFVILDGKEITLNGEELCIADSQSEMCIAGVMGGKNSGVTEATVEIFLEAAVFNSQATRRSSRRHGLQSDSAYRFSRGIDPQQTFKALILAKNFILQTAGGEALEPVEFKSEKFNSATKQIKVSTQTITDRLGFVADGKILQDFLFRLGCKVVPFQTEQTISEDEYLVTPPSWRFDLENEIDFVEEYGRLVGYDKIPETIPAFFVQPHFDNSMFTLQKKIVQILTAAGLRQVQHSSFVSEQKQKDFYKNFELLKAYSLNCQTGPVTLLNPLSEEQAQLKVSLSHELFQNVIFQVRHQQNYGSFFEIGKVYSKSDEGCQEQFNLGFSYLGGADNLWQKNSNNAETFFDLKKCLEILFLNLGISSEVKFAPCVSAQDIFGFINWGQAVKILLKNEVIGYLGSAHPLYLEAEKIRAPVSLCEINLEKVLSASQQKKYKRIVSPSKFPKVVRDLSVIVAKTESAKDICDYVQSLRPDLISEVFVFDVYEGEKVPLGKKSISFQMEFQSFNDTLDEQTAQSVFQLVIDSIKQKYSAALRES
jgi:phenylalanyl-tRNA synthetase beta chain